MSKSHYPKDLMIPCVICGDMFHPRNSLQKACQQTKVRPCPICGKPYTYFCNVKKMVQTCSSECQNAMIKQNREATASELTKVCKWCGEEFHPRYVMQVYCDNAHYNTCVVCGKEFELDVKRSDITQTCSDECRYSLSIQNRDIESMVRHQKETLHRVYGVDSIMQIPGVKEKIMATSRERYGKDWYTQTDEHKERVKKTDLEIYGVKHHLSNPDVIAKRCATNLERYGAENVLASDYGKHKIREHFETEYNAINPSQVKEFKAKATKNARRSKLELRICDLFNEYHIDYQHHYFYKANGFSHEFDFYLPKYKILIDADGLYYHGYLNDPDGVRVRDDYDVVRLSLIPKDHMFFVIVENHEAEQVKEIVDILSAIDSGAFDYEQWLYGWCRSIDFPYPQYSDKRLQKDWKYLKNWNGREYNPKCRLGESLIKQFHKSRYNSPYDCWNNNSLLMKMIQDGCLYKNTVDSSKILVGLELSDICRCDSIFNPVLAKYLVNKYLSKYATVFDPLMGYSGTLLGTVASGKFFRGRSNDAEIITESRIMIDYLKTDSAYVWLSDFQEEEGFYDSLFTAIPDGRSDLISTCLRKFKCYRYVFVVRGDNPYTSNIAEVIPGGSHIAPYEYNVVVVDR